MTLVTSAVLFTQRDPRRPWLALVKMSSLYSYDCRVNRICRPVQVTRSVSFHYSLLGYNVLGFECGVSDICCAVLTHRKQRDPWSTWLAPQIKCLHYIAMIVGLISSAHRIEWAREREQGYVTSWRLEYFATTQWPVSCVQWSVTVSVTAVT